MHWMKILKIGLFALFLVLPLQMSFLESVLLKNRFYFICILDFPLSVIEFLFPPFHFALFLGNTLSFVGIAKVMGLGGWDFSFQSFFSLSCFSFFRAEKEIYSILLRVVMFESSTLKGLLNQLLSVPPIRFESGVDF